MLAVGDGRNLRGRWDFLGVLHDVIKLPRGKIHPFHVAFSIDRDGERNDFDSKLLCKLVWQVRRRVGHQFDTLHTIFLLFRQQKAGHLLSQNLVWLLILYKRDGYKQNSLNYR